MSWGNYFQYNDTYSLLTLSDCVSYDWFLWLIWYLFNHFVTFHSIWLSFQILHITFNQQCFLSTAVLKGYIPSSNYHFRSMYLCSNLKKRTESDILANIFNMNLDTYVFFSKVYKSAGCIYLIVARTYNLLVHIGCHKDTGYFLLLCLNFSQECLCGV